MSDEKMPEQPKTAEIPAADKQEILLAELKVLMVSGFRDASADIKNLDTKVDRLEANLDLQGGELGLMKKEITLIYEWKSDVDNRLKANSQRAQAISNADMEHESKIAATIVRTNELEAVIYDTKSIATSALAELKKQSTAMGIGVRGLKWVTSKDGRKTIVRTATLIAVLYGILHQAGVIK